MSVYDWPDVGDPGGERGDEPFDRRAFVEHGRRPLAHEQALAAGRTLPRPARRRSRGAAAAAAAPLGAPAQDLTNLWLPLGPTVILNGQMEGHQRVSGRVRALAVSDDGQRVYAAAATGGIWYSRDGGTNWSSIGGLAATSIAGVTRPADRNACGAVLAHFDTGGDESKDLVLVGTGEETPGTQARPGHALGGVGILTATGPAASVTPDPWTIEAPNLAGRGVYRLAMQPGGTTVVAATSIGLFQRPDAPAAGVAWAKVASAPFDSFDGACVDVLWTAAGGGFPARLWVWAMGSTSGLWVRPDGADHFTKIGTPGAYNQVSALAASQPASKIYVLNNRYWENDTPKKLPALYQVDASGHDLPAAAAPVAAGVPDVLDDQGNYDIAVAVDPGNPNRVAIAGKWIAVQNPSNNTYVPYNGSVVIGEVGMAAGTLTFGTPNPPTMVGVGLHSDVHDIRYANGGATLWAACDGGVFRSDNPTSQVGFVARNDGLSIAEANFLAPHPTCEGYLVVGLQDNGTVERLSTNVWRRLDTGGDGGGVAFDPAHTDRSIFQYVRAGWQDSAGGRFASLLMRGTPQDAKDEDKASAFYSQPGTIADIRPSGTVGQIVVGTDRVWYTEDFGAHWATLPSGTDPITQATGATPATVNRSQDQLGEAVYACRFGSPDVLWVLTGQRWEQPGGQVFRFERASGSANAGGPGTWTKPAPRILAQSRKGKKDATSGGGDIREAAAWTDLAVNLELGGVQRGSKGAVYLGTAGNPTNTDVDTLYWFDGESTWHATGLRSTVPAPVTAVVCDPANPNRVYVGTTVGVWRGQRILSDGQPPSWPTWDALTNGLPEAAVEDLALFDSDGVRLLRAAIAARGIWELQLDPPLTELCFLRAHDDDQRRRPRALETKRDGSSPRSWHGSPDVRPRRASLALPAPTTLPWTRSDPHVDAEGLRRFQAAFRSKNDPRCRATGVWDLYFEEVLRANGATQITDPRTGASPVCEIDEPLWSATMVAPHATAEPWGAGVPSEADLYELAADLREGDPGAASCTMPPQQLKVDVVVHRRSLAAIDGGDVRVTLLQWIDPSAAHRARYDDPTTWFSGNVPWAAAVNDVLNSAGGTTSATFGGGWAFVGTAANRRQTLAGQTLDPLHSGVATFDIDLRNARQNLVLLLFAVIRPGSDIALAPASLQDLALTSPSVAVRSVRVNPK